MIPRIFSPAGCQMCNNGHAHCPGPSPDPAVSGAGSWGDTVKGAAGYRAIYTQARKYYHIDKFMSAIDFTFGD